MNKKGLGTGVVVVIALLVAMVVAGGFYMFQQTQLPTAASNAKVVTGDCQTDPVISVTALDAINSGTIISNPTIYATVNGEYIGAITSGSTKFSYGDKVQLLVSKDNYIDEVLEPITVKCGENKVVAKLYATGPASFRVFNTNGDLIADDGAGTNQSASSSPINLDVRIDGVTDESTGDLVIVVEADNTTEIDQIKLSGLGGATLTDVPKFYSSHAAGSVTKAFEVPAVVDGATVSGTLTLTPESGQTIGAGTTMVYLNAYSKQGFVDTDGSFKVGVEDSNGNTKYEDNWDFIFYIK